MLLKVERHQNFLDLRKSIEDFRKIHIFSFCLLLELFSKSDGTCLVLSFVYNFLCVFFPCLDDISCETQIKVRNAKLGTTMASGSFICIVPFKNLVEISHFLPGIKSMSFKRTSKLEFQVAVHTDTNPKLLFNVGI